MLQTFLDNLTINNDRRGTKPWKLPMFAYTKVSKEGKMKAVVSITIDNEFVVHDIKVIEGAGLIHRYAQPESRDGEYRDIAHSINSNKRKNPKYYPRKYEIAALEAESESEE